MDSKELFCPDITRQEHIAIKALSKGEATADQQVLALQVVVNKLCVTHDLSYVPGEPSASAFMSGRQFVGYKVIKFTKLPVSDNEGN